MDGRMDGTARASVGGEDQEKKTRFHRTPTTMKFLVLYGTVLQVCKQVEKKFIYRYRGIF